MTTEPVALPQLSIVVVSRGRPRHLALCLAALACQNHPQFEVIVVADSPSAGVCPDLSIKRITFDQANISDARNLGIAAAAAEVVAFIDDDALALPCWASALAATFLDDRVLAAGGFTLGPDGVNWQVRAERLTPAGTSFTIPAVSGLLGAKGGNPVGLLGTNCAFRRDSLLALGGFDPAFPYYLDESDVVMRLYARWPDALTAIVPEAEVIHGFAAGGHRLEAGVPQDLTQIGRSSAIFVRRHGGEMPPLLLRQRRRLLRLMRAGRLDPLHIPRLLRGLQAGINDGQTQPLPDPPAGMETTAPAFLPMPLAMRGPPLVLSGWHWQATILRAKAAQAVAQGRQVALILLSPSILPHRLTRSPGGWWEQTGGLWGNSGPDNTPIKKRGFMRRRQLIDKFNKAMNRRLQSFTLS